VEEQHWESDNSVASDMGSTLDPMDEDIVDEDAVPLNVPAVCRDFEIVLPAAPSVEGKEEEEEDCGGERGFCFGDCRARGPI
jgi:hypothetical protein